MGGPERDVMHYKDAEKLKKPGVNKKARALWTLKNAQEQGGGYQDPGSQRQMKGRASVRQAPWEAHLKSPTAAFEDALWRTEQRAG